MKNQSTIIACAMLMLSVCMTLPVSAENADYGAASAAQLTDNELTLTKMLNLALEDEYLARGEYQKIIDTFGERRPFTNIIKAESTHISLLLPLFDKYNIEQSPDRGLELAVIPSTYEQTFKVGVDAELANIAMYQRFLQKDLSPDVRDVFERLLNGSEHHLAAFEKQLNKN